MPKVYYYTDSQVGIPWLGADADRKEFCKEHNIKHPRFVWYEWPGFTKTTNPNEADVFCVRQRLFLLEKSQINSLPYYRGDARHRHVFFSLGPDGTSRIIRDFSQFPGIFVRAMANPSMLKTDPDIVVWPWPVDDLRQYVKLPPGGFKYDAVFQGSVRGPTQPVLRAIRQAASIKLHAVDARQWWPAVRRDDPTHAAQLRESFCEGIQASRLALCPNSNPHGGVRYRLFEAMSMGRVNFCTGDKGVLPLGDKIRWEDCLVYIPERDIPKMGQIMVDWLRHHTDAQIVKMGLHARAMWEKWLWRDNWGKVIGGLVRERLKL